MPICASPASAGAFEGVLACPVLGVVRAQRVSADQSHGHLKVVPVLWLGDRCWASRRSVGHIAR